MVVGEDLSRLLKEIAAEARATAAHTGIAAFAPAVMKAMGEVPRHEFVPADERASAYLDLPLPIGHGQTISQPYIVALMTDLVAVPPGGAVLEVGAGSGYQAAVLSKLARTVHAIEIVPALARACRERLARLGFANVTVHEGDGAAGLEAEARSTRSWWRRRRGACRPRWWRSSSPAGAWRSRSASRGGPRSWCWRSGRCWRCGSCR
jgi:protein-L-isoaspartate O-methyltransferase